AVRVEVRVETTGPTGVEMEAMTAASVAALNVYDMVKKNDRAATLQSVRLIHKSGGVSGDFNR
ncbi:MAG: cyclic pyranopterin monophosphate synthase MoaC, partial [Myxococcota bacterium]